MKNWKSSVAYIIFVGIYVYTVLNEMSTGIIEVTGYIALYSSLFMMLRNDFTKDMIVTIISNVGSKIKK